MAACRSQVCKAEWRDIGRKVVDSRLPRPTLEGDGRRTPRADEYSEFRPKQPGRAGAWSSDQAEARRARTSRQLADRESLVDAMIEAGLACTATDHFVEVVAADQDELHDRRGKERPQPARGLEPVEPRHVDVEQHELGTPGLRHRERFRAVGGRADLVPQVSQQVAQRCANRGAVVRDQHASALPADGGAPGAAAVPDAMRAPPALAPSPSPDYPVVRQGQADHHLGAAACRASCDRKRSAMQADERCARGSPSPSPDRRGEARRRSRSGAARPHRSPDLRPRHGLPRHRAATPRTDTTIVVPSGE